MSRIEINHDAVQALGDQIAQQTQAVFNEAITHVQGQPLEEATQAVCAKLQNAGVSPNIESVRALLAERGWTN